MPSTLTARALSRAPRERGRALASVPEDQWFDRESISVSASDLADIQIGFANADGGTIVVGLSEGVVEGTDDARAHRDQLMEAPIDLAVPPVRVTQKLVECLSDDGRVDHLLVIEVEPSEMVHANKLGETFLRVGSENRKLTSSQPEELLYDKVQAVFDGTLAESARVEDLDEDLVHSYAELLGQSDTRRLLEMRGLVTRDSAVTAGGYLLFGQMPQALFPEAYVRILRYRGTDPGSGSRQQLVEDVRCEGAIPNVLTEAAEQVRRLQPTRRVLGVGNKFEQRGLIPEDAWLEGLVNAVVHRSYSLAGDHIRIAIFDDRIEVESPGRFPGVSRPAEPGHVSRFARNPRIARVCADLNFGQELGEGIRRIFEEMTLAGLATPVYRETPSSVKLVMSSVSVDPIVESRLPPQSREIIDLVKGSSGLSTGDIADAISLSRPATIRRLTVLQQAGLIEWVGNSPKDPRAFWRAPGE
ncbi:MAG TPA: ATP-binding protein [Egibacteraceae bacterium]|nr:ATP-binding protein [Egibacteraceae bacterium]